MFHSIIHFLRNGGDVLFGVGGGGGPAFNFGLIIRRFNPKMMEGPPPPLPLHEKEHLHNPLWLLNLVITYQINQSIIKSNNQSINLSVYQSIIQ